jgi:uncharacterized protein YycO
MDCKHFASLCSKCDWSTVTKLHGIDIDAADVLPDCGAQQRKAGLHIYTQIATRFL